jgi:DegV family protein with EDD domain
LAGVHIVTDSACDLPISLVERHSITAVPLEVRLEGCDTAILSAATGAEFWHLTETNEGVAQTAAPSPGAFVTAFEAARRLGADSVLCCTLSSALSATYQSARAAAASIEDLEIEVLDTQQATMGEGLLVLLAAELAAAGSGLSECAAAVRAEIARTSTFGTLENLETLRRGGRIGSAQAFLGSLLSIKPVIEIRDGEVVGESKQRTRARSLRYLADKVVAAGPLAALAVVHAAASDVGDFLELLAPVYPVEATIVTAIGPVIGAHTGRGTIGVCLRRASEEVA